MKKTTLYKIFGLLFFITLNLPGPSIAKVYKWVDEKGKVHYTDSPGKIPQKLRSPKKNLESPSRLRPSTMKNKNAPSSPLGSSRKEQMSPALGQQKPDSSYRKRTKNSGNVKQDANLIEIWTACGEDVASIKALSERELREGKSPCFDYGMVENYGDHFCTSIEDRILDDKVCKENVHRCFRPIVCRQLGREEALNVAAQRKRETKRKMKALKKIGKKPAVNTCQNLKKHLEACSSFKCQQTLKGLVNLPIGRSVTGLNNGKCGYEETLPKEASALGMLNTQCQLTKSRRMALANELNLLADAKEYSVGYSLKNGISHTYYTVDGKKFESVISQARIEKECLQNGSSGVALSSRGYMSQSWCGAICGNDLELASCLEKERKTKSYFEASDACKMISERCLSSCEQSSAN